MHALACTLDTWDAYHAVTKRVATEGLTFPLRILEIIGETYGLELDYAKKLDGHDAVFLAVHDFSSMLSIGKSFRKLKLPLLARNRNSSHPLVWAGGQGTRNPLPLAEIADLVVLGDADDSLPQLLVLWERHSNTKEFLVAASTVAGVFVPSVHNEAEITLQMGWSPNIKASLKRHVAITGEHARVEISRGCKSKCAFCGLGWMGPVRHNSALDVLEAINGAGAVHLQACDAEAHPEINRIRNAMRTAGQMDVGCTSRLDSNLKAANAFLYDKRFNFGIEAASQRVRERIGKGQLTNDLIIDAMLQLYDRQKSREAPCKQTDWHMISGLPGETLDDCRELAAVIHYIDEGLLNQVRAAGSLTVRWQPLFPNPGTPSQWLPAGTGCSDWSRRLHAECRRTYALKLAHHEGRGDRKNLLTCLLARSGRDGWRLIEAEGKRRVEPFEAAEMLRATTGELSTDSPLPWDFVQGYYPKDLLLRAYRKMVRP